MIFHLYFCPFLLCIGLFIVGCGVDIPDDVGTASREIPKEISFSYDVKPILSDRCFKCHGPDEAKTEGDLRLDLAATAYKETSSEGSSARFVIKPGNLRQSEVVNRILAKDPEVMMPPPDEHLELSDREKAILLKWIDQGAEYQAHWSFVPPTPQSLPHADDDWVEGPIDQFVFAKLAEEELRPSPPAERTVIMRRLALDLTGLPPRPEHLQDQSLSLTHYVDTLLASPHYGEQMASEWMDVARYADSHGYQDDGLRNTWPYRDWVIDAFNENLPYDTFLLYQLAGDQMDDPTTDQLIATCFNRNHPQTQEGGVIDEEYRVEYVADRVNTIGKGLLGLTMECARCHDHKYDPITQKDYFAFSAYFNNNNDSGIVPYNGEASPTVMLPSEEARIALDAYANEIDSLEALLVSSEYLEDFQDWMNRIDNFPEAITTLNHGLVADFSFESEKKIAAHLLNLDHKEGNEKPKDIKYTYAYRNNAIDKLDASIWGHEDDRPEIVAGVDGKGLKFVGDGGVRFNRSLDYDRHQPFTVSIWIKRLKAGEEGPIFGKTNGDFEGYRGWLCKLNKNGTLSFQLNHVWPDNAIDFEMLDTVPINEWVHIVMSYDGSSRAEGVSFLINGKQPDYRLHADKLKKSLLHGVNGTNWSNQPFLLGMELRKSIQEIVMDELKIYDRCLSKIEMLALSGSEHEKHYAKDEQLDFYLKARKNDRYNQILDGLTEVRKKENLLATDQPEIMVMGEKKYPRTTYLLDRGLYDQPTDSVEASIPAVFKGDAAPPKSRKDFAEWIISPSNPLTSRVAVNRLWKMCFGQGLVETQEDFGNQGSLPTHPELLDWLALRFQALGWDTKALLKEIVSSATYQQSSDFREDLAELDPNNRLYGRYPVQRLSAETIRDQALAGSGLLVPQIGGASVYPYQPAGIWKALATRNATEYHQQSGDSLYRRSLYTVWKRSAPPPSMLSFDAPDRYYCVVRRQETSTPMQALVLMNDPQFMEAARVLAQNLLGQNAKDPAQEAFIRLVGRDPTQEELKTLSEALGHWQDHFTNQSDESEVILEIGEYPVDRQLSQKNLAALTMTVSTIMNFEEFITKR